MVLSFNFILFFFSTQKVIFIQYMFSVDLESVKGFTCTDNQRSFIVCIVLSCGATVMAHYEVIMMDLLMDGPWIQVDSAPKWKLQFTQTDG